MTPDMKEVVAAAEALDAWETSLTLPVSDIELAVFQCCRRLIILLAFSPTEKKKVSVPKEKELHELTLTERTQLAIRFGYTGESCGPCGGFKMIRAGKCSVCQDCGASSGCS